VEVPVGGEQFAITQDQRGSLPLLRVRGEVDIYTAPRLKEAVIAALHPDVPSLIIDLSEVGFLDSTGLQVLMSAKRRTAERGGEVYILGARDHVQRVFYLLGLEKVFVLCREMDLP
jgi:anti-sigma B factor antagonist